MRRTSQRFLTLGALAAAMTFSTSAWADADVDADMGFDEELAELVADAEAKLAEAREDWSFFADASNNTYGYTVAYMEALSDEPGLTRMRVVDGRVVERAYAATADGEELWQEPAYALGSHEEGYAVRTMEQIFDDCDALIHRGDGIPFVELESEEDILSVCGMMSMEELGMSALVIGKVTSEVPRHIEGFFDGALECRVDRADRRFYVLNGWGDDTYSYDVVPANETIAGMLEQLEPNGRQRPVEITGRLDGNVLVAEQISPLE